MNRTNLWRRIGVVMTLTALAAAPCLGANVRLSLNLEPNTPGDLNSGGVWTTVAKADEHGIAGIVERFPTGSLNFNPATGFLVPSNVFEVRQSGTFGLIFEIVQGDDLSPPTLDVGVIGGSFPSSYVDDPDLVLLGANPDLGSFTGGIALATGTYNPGVIPSWASNLEANVFTTGGQAILATVQATVRYVNVPEPATIALVGLCCAGLIAATRRRV